MSMITLDMDVQKPAVLPQNCLAFDMILDIASKSPGHAFLITHFKNSFLNWAMKCIEMD